MRTRPNQFDLPPEILLICLDQLDDYSDLLTCLLVSKEFNASVMATETYQKSLSLANSLIESVTDHPEKAHENTNEIQTLKRKLANCLNSKNCSNKIKKLLSPFSNAHLFYPSYQENNASLLARPQVDLFLSKELLEKAIYNKESLKRIVALKVNIQDINFSPLNSQPGFSGKVRYEKKVTQENIMEATTNSTKTKPGY